MKELTGLGALKTSHIIKAFLRCDRAEFVPQALKTEAYADVPLPIGAGQTISQPYTVAFMLELLEPQPGQKILDVGFGSGWTTALLATIAGERGKVYGLEIVPEVYELGKKNLERFYENQKRLPHPNPLRDRRGRTINNITLLNQSGWEGFPEAAPFDRILVSAAAEEVPEALREQLATGGRMVIPVENSIWLLEKIEDGKSREREYPGFAFVPLV